MRIFILRASICCVAIWMFFTTSVAGQSPPHRRRLTTDIKEIVLENRLLSRKFAVDKGWLRTSHFTNLLTGENIVVSSPEFEIQFENEPVLNSDDFVAEYYTHVLLAGEVKRTLFTLTDKRQRLQLELEYTLGPNDFFVRKRVRLYPLQKSLPRLLSVSVEALKVGSLHNSWPSSSPVGQKQTPPPRNRLAPLELSGQPVFLNDSFFWGMEYPSGHNHVLDGVVRCTQYPGNRISSSGFESHSVVAGVSARGEVTEWFLRYVDTFCLPARPFTILRIRSDRGSDASLTELLEHKMEAIPRNPGRLDRILVDALVLDAGWWRENSSLPIDTSQFPQGLGVLSEALRSRGVGLGLYFPLSSSGFVRESSQTKDAGAAQDSPRSKREPPAMACLADSKYKEALKNGLRELHQGKPLRFIRHDLNMIACQSPPDEHGVETSVSNEAATDALIELLRFERSLNSDLYVSLVGTESPSPWWLQYANDVGPGDLGRGYFRMDLSPRPRDWEIQREAMFLQEYLRGELFQLPLSCLATSSLKQPIQGAIGPKEPEESWADAVAEYLGRGQDLTEFSFDPEQLNTRTWEILRHGLEWKASRQAVFHRGSPVGGAPEKGEPYGYLHWNANQAIAVLHNPSHSPLDTSFRLPKSLRGSLRILETYPRCRVESQLLKAGDIVNTSLEGLETRVLEVNSEGTWSIPLPQDADFIFSSDTSGAGDEKQITLKVFPETPEVRFSQPQSVIGLQLADRSISLDSSGKAQLPDDPKMTNISETLKSFTEKKAEVGVYAKRGVQLTLPGWLGAKSSLSIWLLQPQEQRGNFPLYVTLDRKQVNLGDKESFTPTAETRTWNFYSLPLKFDRQVLLDWAIKDIKDVSLYLWWEIAAPRPALEFSYRLASGKAKDTPPPLLSSPRANDYIVRIPLETVKAQPSADTP